MLQQGTARMKKTCIQWVVAASLLLSAATPAHSQVVLQHSGATNPTNEGFTLDTYANPQVGPVMNDSGFNAWAIATTGPLDVARYIHTLTPAEQSRFIGADWELTCTLRILQAPAQPSYDISAGYGYGNLEFDLFFGATTSGDPIVQLKDNFQPGPAVVLSGAGSTYNTYSVFYHAATRSADLWANGTFLYSAAAGGTDLSPPVVSWGGHQDVIDVHANWALVSLEVVPEPSSLSLAVCAFFLLRLRKRARPASR
jgi:hypothetical protein